jgi:Fe-S oxidoreductase
VATLATGRDDGVAPAEMARCTGCGLCDALCPAALSPRALAVDVRERLTAGGVGGRPRALTVGLDRALLTLRLDLARYDRPPDLAL